MKLPVTKHIIILLLSVLVISSCRSQKKVFNGKVSLDCPEYDESFEKKDTKKRIIEYLNNLSLLNEEKIKIIIIPIET